MKSAREWLADLDKALYPAQEEDVIRAIQADALEAAARAVNEMARRPADKYPLVEGKYCKTFTLADIDKAIRSLLPPPQEKA